MVNKACYMAVGVDMDGIKHILGLWIADNEGAAFWASVCADLANRGVQDVFIVCCDGLKGLPEAVEATWPNSMVQTCIVHLIRAANRWVSYQDRKGVSRALREVYTAANEDTARASLDAFEASELGRKLPAIGQSLARCLGAVRAVSAVPASSEAGALHHEFDRIAEC